MNTRIKRSSLLFSSLLFSSLLFSSAVEAKEDNGKGIYVQADWVHAREKAENDYFGQQVAIADDYKKIKTHSNHPRFSIGYDFGNWRLALDYSHYDRWSHSKRIVGEQNKTVNTNKINLKAIHFDQGTFQARSSYGISAIYDLDLNSKFKPYAGVRISVGKIRHSVYLDDKAQITVTPQNANPLVGPVTDAHPPYHDSHNIKRIGFGFIGGIGYDITPNITLDLGYRYNDWGRLENVRFKTHEASFGVRYRF
ncbi:TPA: opacity family porin [Haemophilus influenzae]